VHWIAWLAGLAALPALAQTPPAPTPASPPQPPAVQQPQALPKIDQWLPQLQKGLWVSVEGAWLNGALQAEEIKVVHGALDQFEVASLVTSVDATTGRFRTQLGVEVVTNERTEFQEKDDPPLGFAALQPGVMVEADGQLQRDGTLLADEVEIRSMGRERRSTDKPDEHELTGRIDSVDPAARTLTVFGVTVRCDERTRNKTRFLH
jgi:hypothetical protein